MILTLSLRAKSNGVTIQMKPLELFESRGTIHYAKKLILIFEFVAEILRRFATTIFCATKRCNIVETLFRMVTTLFQHCNAVLR